MPQKGKNSQYDASNNINPQKQPNRNPSANPGQSYSQPQKKSPGGK